MSITYPLSLPSTPGIKRFTWLTSNAVSLARSPFTYVTQVQAHNGQIWKAEVTMPPMERADAEQWTTFLLQLMGTKGTFYLGDPLGKTPRGTATGTPLVNGGSQTGNSLITDGWTSSVTGILKAGDYIQIGQRLYKNLKDVNSDGSGNATLDIYPRLRETPSDNASILTTNTVGLFRLQSSEVPVYEADTERVYSITFTAIEAI